MVSIKQIGSFPAPGPELRETGELVKITEETALSAVSGRKLPTLMKLFVSNDVVNVGTITIPCGGIGPRQTEFDAHDGDAVFYVEKGDLTFTCPETLESFLVHPGEYMFMPEKTTYKIINYSGEVAKVVFVVAPKM